MAQEQLEGIANATYATGGTLTWETAADWDNAASEAGVVHEARYDLPGADIVRLGWPSFDRGGSALSGYWPQQEASGSTINDVSGNGLDGSMTGGNFQAGTGPWGDSYLGYDGNDDKFDVPDNSLLEAADGESLTVACLYFHPGASEREYIAGKEANRRWHMEIEGTIGGNPLRWEIDDDSSLQRVDSTTDTMDGAWHLGVGVWDHDTELRMYVDGTKENTTGEASYGSIANNEPMGVGYAEINGGDHWGSGLAHLRIWKRPLTDAQVTALWDALTGGHLETATKSFGSPTTPDLQNLSYSLNGETIDLKVIGSPGTASEEVVTQTLDGSAGYALTWSASHQDFRLRPEFSTAGITNTTPTFSRGELTA